MRQHAGTPLLRPLFGGNDPTFVVSDTVVADYLRNRRLRTVDIGRALADPPQDVVLVMDGGGIASLDLDEVRQRFSQSRVLLVPCAAFDARPHAVTYTLARLLDSDFERSVARNQAHKKRLEAASPPLLFHNPGFPGMSLVCELPDGVRAEALAEVRIDAGRWREIPEFFEVSLALPVVVRGDLPVMGMLAARHSRMPAELFRRHDEAVALVHEFGSRHSAAILRSEGGRPVGFRSALSDVAAADLIHTIRRLASTERRPTYVEVSIGTNPLGAAVQWHVNSCMNEGMEGLHIAVGDAVTGVHLDFVSPGTVLEN
jgi:hypothetical protein